MLPDFIQKHDSGWYLHLKVQPGARKNEIAGESEGALRVRLCAPAVENKANAALVAFIAGLLRIKKNQARLVSGAKHRQKKIFIPAEAEPFFPALYQPAAEEK